MKSMTGYGRASTGTGTGSAFTVELRTVNHRGLDLKIRSAESDAFCDMEITRLVRGSIERGSVAVTIREEGASSQGLSAVRIKQSHATLDQIRKDLGLPNPVDLSTVAAFLALDGRSSNSLHGEALWTLLKPAVEEALRELHATRLREGQSLLADMTSRLHRLAEIVQTIQTALEPLPERFTRRLNEKLTALKDLPGYEPGRVAQEIALLVDRLDVSEELVRLRTHFDHVRALFSADVSVGRKLDFLIQEIGREINTLGSKSQDAGVAAMVIEAKSELEKIREQAQNIE